MQRDGGQHAAPQTQRPANRGGKKRKKNKGPQGLNNPHKDAHQRINFLYQAAHVAIQQGHKELARHHIRTMRGVARKLVLRLDPEVKRTICKKCDMLLVPGKTARIRVRAHRDTHQVLVCLECGFLKRYPTPFPSSTSSTCSASTSSSMETQQHINSCSCSSCSSSSCSSSSSSSGRHPQQQEEETRGTMIEVPQHMHSRLLYPNPLCILTVVASTDHSSQQRLGVVVAPFVTCLSNWSKFCCCLKSSHYVTAMVLQNNHFVLNVAAAGMEELTAKLPGPHNEWNNNDAPQPSSLNLCKPGDCKPLQAEQIDGNDVALINSPAHMRCAIEATLSEETAEDLVLLCRIERAFVRAEYWDGKTFLGRTPKGRKAIPPPPFVKCISPADGCSPSFAIAFPL